MCSRGRVLVVSVVAVVIGFATSVAVPAAWATFTQTTSAAGSVSTATLAAPSALTVSGSANLSWTATTSSWASGTRVFRATTSGGPYTQIAQISGLATTTYTDSPGSGTFYYVVEAYYNANSANWTSVNSNEANTTGAITLIQTTTGGYTTTTVAATFASVPTPGSLLIAIFGTRQNGTITGPTGWSSAINQGGGGVPNEAVFYKIAGNSEPTTVTMSTTATGNGNGLQLYEYRGVSTLDTIGSATGTGTAVTSGSLTTSQPNELVIAALVAQQGTNFANASWTNSFTEEQDFTAGGGGGVTVFAGADRITTSTSTYSTTATSNASGNWRGQIVAFR